MSTGKNKDFHYKGPFNVTKIEILFCSVLQFFRKTFCESLHLKVPLEPFSSFAFNKYQYYIWAIWT